MYSVTPQSTAHLVRLTLSGKISGKEYAEICVLLREAQNETNLRSVAVVGDRRRYKWARVLVRGFHAETRYFDQAHRTRAIRWLAESTGRVASASSSAFLGDATYRGIAVQRQKQKNKQTTRRP